MNDVLFKLASDQAKRADDLLLSLRGRKSAVSSVASLFLDHVARRLGEIGEALRLLKPGSKAIQSAWEEYSELSYSLRNLEFSSVVAFVRFTEGDAALFRVVERMAAESKLARVPLAVGWSTSHYHLDKEGVLYVPRGERASLLGWSDIYHELSHRQMDARPDLFHDPVVQLIRKYFGDKIGAATTIPETTVLSNFRSNWSGPPVLRRKDERLGWYIEVVSDLLAAYVCGPAYASSHVRLSWNFNIDPFSCNASHPADAARFNAIMSMLIAIGIDASEARSEWDTFVKLTASKEPRDYVEAHPPEVIEQIRDAVLDGCQRSGVIEYSHAGADDVCRILNAAWQRFRNDDPQYAAWEEQELKRLLG
jgi:hypothetical protein